MVRFGSGGPVRGRGPNYVVDPNYKVDQKAIIKRLWKYLKKYSIGLFFVLMAVVLSAGLMLATPWLIQVAIDDYIDISTVNLTGVLAIVVSLIVIAIVNAIMSYIQQASMVVIANKVARDIRKDAFDNLQNLPVKYYDTNHHGQIMSMLTNDIDAISGALSQAVPQIISSVITVVGALLLMFLSNWALALVAIATIPIMLGLTVFISKRTSKFFRTQQEKIGALNSVVEENVGGLKAIKLYNQERVAIETFKKTNKELRKVSFKAQFYTGLMMPIVIFINNLTYGIIVTVGAIFNIHLNGLVSVGQIQAVASYSRQFNMPISNLAQLMNVIQAAIAGGDRVFKLMDEKSEYLSDPEPSLEKVSGRVEFKNVNFGYEANKQVLKNVTFWGKPGQVIAIVGPTGSGKTTIINLLTRYYDIESGDIQIDQKSIYGYAKKSLREKIGIVLQQTYLFRGTILENIKYGKVDATFEEVVEAAKLAQVHDIIERLPKGYETKVKEGGSNFSHGERQLISIARTLLANPAILVLDEATSSVDTRTEANIQKSMVNLMKGRTSFVIAHRLQTIRNADAILVVKDGEIIERGTHDDLLKLEGFYYNLYKAQFADA
ncbi:MAG TPA: ABC transporter ATP-binding protein [Bacilli bacterium]|nr:ABC transporter ATP-binding protein [Bacilli bacterium]